MKTPADTHPLPLPPALLAEIEAAAAEEHRPVADVLRDAVERWLGERSWQAHAEKESKRAQELGVEGDDQPMTEAYRRSIHEKIGEGLASAREGKLVDGEAFMAEMQAELTELARQGHK